MKGFVPSKKLARLLHGLFLQLLTVSIPELTNDENESKNVGSDEVFFSKNIVVKLEKRETEDCVKGLATLQTGAWAGINPH